MKTRIAKLLRMARATEDAVMGDLELESKAADVCEIVEEMAEVVGLRIADAERDDGSDEA